MKKLVGGRTTLKIGMVAVLACLCASHASTQDPDLKPNYGSVTLKAGFEPDPYIKTVEAGGKIQTKLGGVTAWVDKAPDFQVNYTAGEYPLIFHVKCEKDTTLLINLPDGKWIANDDASENNLNPLIKLAKPQSGRYNIWVGTFDEGMFPKAKLYVTELEPK